jgi:hypothetical protein
MRFLASTILAIAIVVATAPTHAQTYDPNFPVCLHVFGPVGYIDCRYTSLSQCKFSASGRPAQCEINPYFVSGRIDKPVLHHHRRHYRSY